jgi:hypothetical protein
MQFSTPLSVNLWCRLLNINFIGLHVIEGRSRAPHYRNLLEIEILLQFREYVSCNTKTTWFRHDGAHLQFDRGITEL